MNLKTRQTQTITSKQKSKQVPRIRIASFLELPENRFNDFVVGVENRPLFKKLISPVDDSNKVISYKRFAHTGLYLNTTELYEGATRDRTTEDVESLLVSRPGVAEIVISIGIEKFKKYFLDNEDNVSVADISAACGISPNDVVEVNSLVMDMSLHQEFYGSPTTNYAHESHFHKVAVIEHDGTGDFFIKFCSSRYNSGKYVIDDAKLKILKEKNTFTISELADLNNLLGDIELINERKTSLYQILYQLIHKQKSYMSSGDIRHLCAYTQKELASDIECDTSTASRALDGRSIETPQGEEKPLRFFCPSKKDVRKHIITEILTSHRGLHTDMDIKRILQQTYRLEVSRRTVNDCRNELQFKGKGGK